MAERSREYPRWLVLLVEALRWITGMALLIAIFWFYPAVAVLILRLLVAFLGN